MGGGRVEEDWGDQCRKSGGTLEEQWRKSAGTLEEHWRKGAGRPEEECRNSAGTTEEGWRKSERICLRIGDIHILSPGTYPAIPI